MSVRKEAIIEDDASDSDSGSYTDSSGSLKDFIVDGNASDEDGDYSCSDVSEDDSDEIVSHVSDEDVQSGVGEADEGETCTEASLDGIDTSNIIVGKRVRRRPNRLVDSMLAEEADLFLDDVPDDELSAALSDSGSSCSTSDSDEYDSVTD